MAGPQGKPAPPGILNIRIGCAHSSKTLSPFWSGPCDQWWPKARFFCQGSAKRKASQNNPGRQNGRNRRPGFPGRFCCHFAAKLLTT